MIRQFLDTRLRLAPEPFSLCLDQRLATPVEQLLAGIGAIRARRAWLWLGWRIHVLSSACILLAGVRFTGREANF
jgi:hypothetical protein